MGVKIFVEISMMPSKRPPMSFPVPSARIATGKEKLEDLFGCEARGWLPRDKKAKEHEKPLQNNLMMGKIFD